MTDNIQTTEPLWTVADIAAWAQLAPGSVRNMASRGMLPEPIRIGRAVRWQPNTIRAHFGAEAVAA